MATTTQTSEDQPPRYTPRTTVSAAEHPFTNPAWTQSDYKQILFEFTSPRHGHWLARMSVRTRDLPRLMREGIPWTADNIHREAGYMKRGALRPYFAERAWKHCRIFYLSSLEKNGRGGSGDGMHLWAAQLDVYARTTADLVRFRPEIELVPERITLAEAYDGRTQKGSYYLYRKGRPRECYNVIYGDMPLPGAWPWPKEAESREGGAARKGSGFFVSDIAKDERKKECVVM